MIIRYRVEERPPGLQVGSLIINGLSKDIDEATVYIVTTISPKGIIVKCRASGHHVGYFPHKYYSFAPEEDQESGVDKEPPLASQARKHIEDWKALPLSADDRKVLGTITKNIWEAIDKHEFFTEIPSGTSPQLINYLRDLGYDTSYGLGGRYLGWGKK